MRGDTRHHIPFRRESGVRRRSRRRLATQIGMLAESNGKTVDARSAHPGGFIRFLPADRRGAAWDPTAHSIRRHHRHSGVSELLRRIRNRGPTPLAVSRRPRVGRDGLRASGGDRARRSGARSPCRLPADEGRRFARPEHSVVRLHVDVRRCASPSGCRPHHECRERLLAADAARARHPDHRQCRRSRVGTREVECAGKAVFKAGAHVTANGRPNGSSTREPSATRGRRVSVSGGIHPYGADVPAPLPVEPGFTHRGYAFLVARFVPEHRGPLLRRR